MKFLLTKEVAEICRVSVRTVEKWRRYGQGPRYIKLATGQVRYPFADVQRFLEYYRSPPQKPFKKGCKHWEEQPNE